MTALQSIQLNDGSHTDSTKNSCPAEHPTPRPSGGGLPLGGCAYVRHSACGNTTCRALTGLRARHTRGTSPHGRALAEYRLQLRGRLAALPSVFPRQHGPRARLPGPDGVPGLRCGKRACRAPPGPTQTAGLFTDACRYARTRTGTHTHARTPAPSGAESEKEGSEAGGLQEPRVLP